MAHHRREFPSEIPAWSRVSDDLTVTPDTMLQALMEAAPGHEPIRSKEEIQPLREAVVDCIEQLTDEHQFVLAAIFAERLSLRELGARLGVSHVHAGRLRDKALTELKIHMLNHPTIKEYLDE